ncbi:MAG: flagellar biosynthesis protein FlhA, partial [Pseudomonadales bacterium]|nr:flagellar biosynthesis protein FlhA [Pseudomonadales bacterium]
TVVATHLNRLLQKQVHELLGHEEAQQMIDRLARHAPRLAEALVPDTVSMSVLLRVLKGLLAEQVPVRDLRTIAESIVANVAFNQDPGRMIEAVRVSLARAIVQEIYGNLDNLPVITLAMSMEQLLLKSMAQQASGELSLEPGLAEQLQSALAQAVQSQEMGGKPAVLLVTAALRPVLARLARYGGHNLSVLSYNEIPDDKQITIEHSVG